MLVIMFFWVDRLVYSGRRTEKSNVYKYVDYIYIFDYDLLIKFFMFYIEVKIKYLR